jgi:hypothetical protein
VTAFLIVGHACANSETAFVEICLNFAKSTTASAGNETNNGKVGHDNGQVETDCCAGKTNFAIVQTDVDTVGLDFNAGTTDSPGVLADASPFNPRLFMAKPRVDIPRNPGERLKLAAAILAKHTALAATSPLKDLNWTATGPTVATATGLDTAAKQLEKDLEKAYGDRDALMPAIDKEIARSRDLLLALYRDNPRKLGDYGFVVNDTTPAKKAKPAAK